MMKDVNITESLITSAQYAAASKPKVDRIVAPGT
jgi:hypothetical protein